MKGLSIRLGHVWNMIPENHKVTLRVKRHNKNSFYSEGYYDKSVDACPYNRQFAVVLSVYAITTEVLEITIAENMPIKEGE